MPPFGPHRPINGVPNTVDVSDIGALTFDVFGTVVDWRGSVIREGERLSAEKRLEVDWSAFADDWRNDGYTGGMERVRRGDLPWMKVDALHRLKLGQLLQENGITGLTEAETDHLNLVWHRLSPWSDVLEGLERLSKGFVVASLSNGNMSLLTNMAKNAGIHWDCVLSAELSGHYKPDPEVYRVAADLLGFRTDQVLMVAAHKDDLKGAQRAGLRTAYVPKPDEFGSEGEVDMVPDSSFDLFATDFVDLAARLGI